MSGKKFDIIVQEALPDEAMSPSIVHPKSLFSSAKAFFSPPYCESWLPKSEWNFIRRYG